jgi:hypothetical protein
MTNGKGHHIAKRGTIKRNINLILGSVLLILGVVVSFSPLTGAQ